ncbi:conserved phage C-terminal domain-containing protein [Cytobacillus firmus]|uniref:conserved phage C-terminal domain-containing protein n=1 Tax=Cytobacillus firmus TaxID=1399 RepID=UPI0013314508|nr:conserved phage C-terminal domain-containing protein [Cytobacillus firmus]MEC1893518.1 conserved phage C-terminal domain-containing protein [Cytobacillus firmus]MED1907270.1 conserved phage C-terminal domain-containing protein [Cytobacillus firmus]MED4451697.1 conserved phage C-terminal domain-containing protein [Cytobacillus firmus]MED4767808.1 conserved phage C-terminal domain-containing protein [Cytobacillus firmus]NUH83983.1 conserved phage C-terminal domain-containing protein [Cytobaci
MESIKLHPETSLNEERYALTALFLLNYRSVRLTRLLNRNGKFRTLPSSNISNEKTDSDYRESSRKSRSLIRDWWEQGFTLADFQKVIDLKSAEWKRDPQYSRYLRPETLFGSKFETYLNQKPQTKHLQENDFKLDD